MPLWEEAHCTQSGQPGHRPATGGRGLRVAAAELRAERRGGHCARSWASRAEKGDPSLTLCAAHRATRPQLGKAARGHSHVQAAVAESPAAVQDGYLREHSYADFILTCVEF